jgi:hypothetical protein
MGWLYAGLGVIVVLIVAVLWATIGGAAMALLFFAVLYLVSVGFAYALGRNHEGEAMRNGATIALTAQKSDDTRDIAQMSALGKLFRDLVPIMRQLQDDGQGQAQKQQPPALPFPSMGGGDWAEGQFKIVGFDDDDESEVMN